MSTVTDYKVRQRHSSVSRVMVDAFRGETLTSLIHFHRLDGSNILQLIDDVVALDIRVRIRGVDDLEREVGQGQARVPRARPDPKNPFVVRRTVGVQPEACGSPCPSILGPHEAHGPEPDVMPLPRTVADCLLKPDQGNEFRLTDLDGGGCRWRFWMCSEDLDPQRLCDPAPKCHCSVQEKLLGARGGASQSNPLT